MLIFAVLTALYLSNRNRYLRDLFCGFETLVRDHLKSRNSHQILTTAKFFVFSVIQALINHKTALPHREIYYFLHRNKTCMLMPKLN